ncbi:unnamed protein product, partial [Chrysoparadoxa australica]
GAFSDRFGRKPVLLIGMLSCIIFSLLFGLSQTLWQALLSRFLMGCLNGIVCVSKVTISEICGPDHEVEGMGYLTGTWAISFVVGPALGGLLSQPAVHFEKTFTNEVWKRFPFLLPNLAIAGIATVSFLLVLLFLPETLHRDNAKHTLQIKGGSEAEVPGDLEMGESNQCGLTEGEEGSAEGKLLGAEDEGGAPDEAADAMSRAEPGEEQLPQLQLESARLKQLLTGKLTRRILGLYFGFSMISIAFDEVLPLLLCASLERGGLDWNTHTIGKALCTVGILLIFFQFAIYPVIARRVSYVR